MLLLKKIIKFISKPKENYPNIYIFSYHALKGLQKILVKFKLYKYNYRGQDMFNWSLYNLHYKGELIEAKKKFSLKINNSDYIMEDGRLTKMNDNIKPLHSSHRFLYETIILLQPDSIFEMGCGTGMHLHNLQALLSDAKLSGMDLLESQTKILRRVYPSLNATIKVADATFPFPENFMPPADLAFTQAVIMHIHTGDAHLIALANLFKMAKKYVILMESVKNHPFMEDIKKLHTEKKIDWENIYFYYRINADTDQPTAIICSKEKLPFPELINYKIYFDEV